jgi:hypothetical protein
MKQIKVKVFSNFCTSEVCKENFERTYKANLIENYGPDKKIHITCDDDYTHAVILNCAMPELTINKKNVLGLACEPFPFLRITPEFIEYAKKYIGKYFIGDKMDLGNPFVEGHGFMWFDHPSANNKIEKKKIMSIVFSEKMSAPGHQYRHALASQIIINNFPIDIYGRGCVLLPENVRSRPNIKGSFNKTEPYDDYIFTIAIENFISSQYFSEKIMTPIMCETIPVYLGCKSIDRHVGDRYIQLSGKIREDVDLIKDILKNPYKYMREIKTTKEEVFDNLNFLKKIEEVFCF